MAKTPADKWNESVKKYRNQCQNILQTSDHVRYAGVINIYGRTIAGLIRTGLKPMLKSEYAKNEFSVVSSLMSLRNPNASSIGKMEHVLLQHKKVTILILQKKDVIYYVSIDKKEKDLDGIVSKIKKTI